MKTQLCLSALLLVGMSIPPPAGAYDPNDKLLKQALQLYNQGHVDRAIPLFLQDLKDNPNNGTAHYYLGMALKEQGADANAINELELAAKFLPAGVTKNLAKKALLGGFEEDPLPEPVPLGGTKPAPAPPQNWFSPIINFFQPPPKPVVAPTAPAPAATTPSFPAMPDLGDAWHDTKHWFRSQGKALRNIGKKPSDARQTANGEPDVIPMGEMLNLADDSRKLSAQKQSHPGSPVVVFEQAPENSREWDAWISRFRRTFDSQVFRHIFKDAKDEKTGTASVIFSVDRQGHLRGAVYSATADDTMQQTLLKAIRELDKSYVLAFPPDSRISGWNFRMTWNFGKALTFVSRVREHRAKLAAERKMITIDTNALIKKAKQDQLAAQAKKLAEDKKRIAKTKLAVRVPPPPVIKTDVNAQLIKPVELKASALKLSDMPVLPKSAVPLTADDMDDFNILNRDLSGLFH